MSQSGLLNEEEIKNFVNENFHLKLDKEAFLKPNKDVVTDIYTKFLDDFQFDWRKPLKNADPTQEPNLKLMMVGWLRRKIFDRYNTGYNFHMGDLIMPTRKRTTAFLNVLIYMKAQLDESWAIWQEWKNEWAMSQEEIEKIDREIAKRTIELDELALRKGTSKSIDELREQIKEKQAIFDDLKMQVELEGEAARKQKSENNSMIEINERKQNEVDSLDEEIQRYETDLKLLNEGRRIDKRIHDSERSIQNIMKQIETSREECEKTKKKMSESERLLGFCQLNNDGLAKEIDTTNGLFIRLKEEKSAIEARFRQAKNVHEALQTEKESHNEQLSNAERSKTKMRLQSKIKEEQARHNLEQEMASRKEYIHQAEMRLNQLKEEHLSIERERAEISVKLSADSENCEAIIEESRRQVENLKKRRDESKRVRETDVSVLRVYRTQMENLMGGQAKGVKANQTYIIESAASMGTH